MNKIDLFMKYTGTKRSLAPEIISYFPDNINVFIEPFCGSAAITQTMIANKCHAKKHIISDKNDIVINLLKRCKLSPQNLVTQYENQWRQFNKYNCIQSRKYFYHHQRDVFNKTKDPAIFLFLNRTCINGIIRFNKNGEFNSSCHFTRPGIDPVKLNRIIMDSHKYLQDVEILNKDYLDYFGDEGFFFLDPPYQSSKELYLGGFDDNQFLGWINKIDQFALTYGNEIDLSDKFDFYPLKSYKSGHSTVLNGKDVIKSESIYLKIRV